MFRPVVLCSPGAPAPQYCLTVPTVLYLDVGSGTIFPRQNYCFKTSHGLDLVTHTVHLNLATIWNGDNELFHIPCKRFIFAISNVAIFIVSQV